MAPEGAENMRAIYEVWDTETADRIAALSTKAEAVALLDDVLRVNGPDVAREFVVLAYPDDGSDTALEGKDFVSGAMLRPDRSVGG